MYAIDEFRDSVNRIVDVLVRWNVRFHITGGVAAVAYGDPRMTQDVDFVIDRRQLLNCLPEFLAALPPDRFLVNSTTVRQALEHQKQFQLFDIQLALKFDFYPRELIAGELDRSVRRELLDGWWLPVASRTDTALSKLIWINLGSGKSRRDLRQLLSRASDDELRTVWAQASRMEMAALLEDVLAEPDELS